jgi:hypothetical protein
MPILMGGREEWELYEFRKEKMGSLFDNMNKIGEVIKKDRAIR